MTKRAAILLASITMAVAACGKKDQAGDAGNVEQGLTAEAIVANDVTAIDAVTADAANMAADVDINFTNEFADENAASSSSNSTTATKPRPRDSQPAKPSPRPAPAPAAETASPAPTANATE